MRFVLILVLVLLPASTLRAQATGDVAAEEEASAPAAPTSPPVEVAAARPERAPAEERATDPILDAGFWRSVLAGVIVTVISALILRAIL